MKSQKEPSGNKPWGSETQGQPTKERETVTVTLTQQSPKVQVPSLIRVPSRGAEADVMRLYQVPQALPTRSHLCGT